MAEQEPQSRSSLRISAADRAAAKAKHELAEEAAREEQLRAAREKFEEFDADGNGTLDREEIGMLVRWVLASFLEAGQHGSVLTQARVEAEVDKLLVQVDTDGDGVVDLQEFTAWFIPTSKQIQAFNYDQELRKKQKYAQKQGRRPHEERRPRTTERLTAFYDKQMQRQLDAQSESQAEPEPEHHSEQSRPDPSPVLPVVRLEIDCPHMQSQEDSEQILPVVRLDLESPRKQAQADSHVHKRDARRARIRSRISSVVALPPRQQALEEALQSGVAIEYAMSSLQLDPEREFEPKSEVNPQSEPKSEANPQSEPQGQPEQEPGSKPEVETDPELQPDPKLEQESQPELEAKADVEEPRLTVAWHGLDSSQELNWLNPGPIIESQSQSQITQSSSEEPLDAPSDPLRRGSSQSDGTRSAPLPFEPLREPQHELQQELLPESKPEPEPEPEPETEPAVAQLWEQHVSLAVKAAQALATAESLLQEASNLSPTRLASELSQLEEEKPQQVVESQQILPVVRLDLESPRKQAQADSHVHKRDARRARIRSRISSVVALPPRQQALEKALQSGVAIEYATSSLFDPAALVTAQPRLNKGRLLGTSSLPRQSKTDPDQMQRTLSMSPHGRSGSGVDRTAGEKPPKRCFSPEQSRRRNARVLTAAQASFMRPTNSQTARERETAAAIHKRSREAARIEALSPRRSHAASPSRQRSTQMPLQLASDCSATSLSTSEVDTTSSFRHAQSPSEEDREVELVGGRVLSFPSRSIASPTEFFAPRREWEKKLTTTHADTDAASTIDADGLASGGFPVLASGTDSSDELAPLRSWLLAHDKPASLAEGITAAFHKAGGFKPSEWVETLEYMDTAESENFFAALLPPPSSQGSWRPQKKSKSRRHSRKRSTEGRVDQ